MFHAKPQRRKPGLRRTAHLAHGRKLWLRTCASQVDAPVLMADRSLGLLTCNLGQR